FQLERYVAATVILKTPDGKFLSPGAAVLHAESGKRGVVGYDGMTFVEDLQALNHLTVQGKGASCRAQFAYETEAGRQLPTLGPFVCQPLTEGKQ
ncbi:fimbrial biogenesis outer membrane usher protein, partial [Achromobacter sp. Marseille-Q0513]|uniref:FimD/PapC C-terminal domain-containing protein n=1 Tax=Achromobacter sp. Marseille-Q0513 TaxID=2829161 RepID=UPI001B998F6F